MDNSIPNEHRNKINDAVSNGLDANDWEYIAQLSGGLTGIPVYKIKVDDKLYVIKLESTEDKEFDLVRNYEIIHKVSAQEICPKVYLADSKQGILLMEYIDPKRAEPTPENIKHFASQIKKLHDGNSFAPWKSVIIEVLVRF